jgi:outer membrane protein OmpA-like peptidoglycan-associated protein
MSSRIRRTAVTVSALLLLTVNSWGAVNDLIAPKGQKPAAEKSPVIPVNEPKTTPCPEETGWLLSTMPLTTTEKKDETFSKSAGATFLPEDMQNELMSIAVKENISLNELCGKLKGYKTRLEEYSGDPKEYNRQRMLILEEMLDCRKSCGKILNKFARLYTESSRIYFSGIVRFNFGSRKVDGKFKGDKTHGNIQIDNEEQLKAVLAKWKKDPSQRIQLDARSSIPGSNDVNDRISRIRAEAVQSWLTSRGVPQSQISIKWLGKYGPLINLAVARAYNIEEMFNEYKNNQASQSTSLIGSQGFESFFDGLNQSVSIFVMP